MSEDFMWIAKHGETLFQRGVHHLFNSVVKKIELIVNPSGEEVYVARRSLDASRRGTEVHVIELGVPSDDLKSEPSVIYWNDCRVKVTTQAIDKGLVAEFIRVDISLNMDSSLLSPNFN
jgi:hypothetical protein